MLDIPVAQSHASRLKSDIRELEGLAALICEMAVPYEGIIVEAMERLLELAGTKDFLPAFSSLQMCFLRTKWARDGRFDIGYIIPWIQVYACLGEGTRLGAVANDCIARHSNRSALPLNRAMPSGHTMLAQSTTLHQQSAIQASSLPHALPKQQSPIRGTSPSTSAVALQQNASRPEHRQQTLPMNATAHCPNTAPDDALAEKNAVKKASMVSPGSPLLNMFNSARPTGAGLAVSQPKTLPGDANLILHKNAHHISGYVQSHKFSNPYGTGFFPAEINMNEIASLGLMCSRPYPSLAALGIQAAPTSNAQQAALASNASVLNMLTSAQRNAPINSLSAANNSSASKSDKTKTDPSQAQPATPSLLTSSSTSSSSNGSMASARSLPYCVELNSSFMSPFAQMARTLGSPKPISTVISPSGVMTSTYIVTEETAPTKPPAVPKKRSRNTNKDRPQNTNGSASKDKTASTDKSNDTFKKARIEKSKDANIDNIAAQKPPLPPSHHVSSVQSEHKAASQDSSSSGSSVATKKTEPAATPSTPNASNKSASTGPESSTVEDAVKTDTPKSETSQIPVPSDSSAPSAAKKSTPRPRKSKATGQGRSRSKQHQQQQSVMSQLPPLPPPPKQQPSQQMTPQQQLQVQMQLQQQLQFQQQTQQSDTLSSTTMTPQNLLTSTPLLGATTLPLAGFPNTGTFAMNGLTLNGFPMNNLAGCMPLTQAQISMFPMMNNPAPAAPKPRPSKRAAPKSEDGQPRPRKRTYNRSQNAKNANSNPTASTETSSTATAAAAAEILSPNGDAVVSPKDAKPTATDANSNESATTTQAAPKPEPAPKKSRSSGQVRRRSNKAAILAATDASAIMIPPSSIPAQSFDFLSATPMNSHAAFNSFVSGMPINLPNVMNHMISATNAQTNLTGISMDSMAGSFAALQNMMAGNNAAMTSAAMQTMQAMPAQIQMPPGSMVKTPLGHMTPMDSSMMPRNTLSMANTENPFASILATTSAVALNGSKFSTMGVPSPADAVQSEQSKASPASLPVTPSSSWNTSSVPAIIPAASTAQHQMCHDL